MILLAIKHLTVRTNRNLHNKRGDGSEMGRLFIVFAKSRPGFAVLSLSITILTGQKSDSDHEQNGKDYGKGETGF